jgi:hypothetical protein
MIEFNVKYSVKCKEKTLEEKEKLCKHLSIYNNFKEYSIDKLNLRKQPKKDRLFFTSPSGKKCKSMHIVLDRNDLSKSYKTMQLLCNYSNEQPIDYYLDIKNGIVRKLKEVVRYYKKHNLTLDYNLIYHGKKSQAIKRLEKLMA